MRRTAIFVTIILLNAFGVLQAQWVQTSVSKLAGTPVAINNLTHIYAFYYINDKQQFMRSSDDGATWENIYNKNLDSVTSTGNIVTVKENNGYLIAEVKNDSGYAGIYRSTDNGASWQRANGSGFAIDNIVKFYSFDSLLLGVENYWGLLLSTDNGNNWKIVFNDSSDRETSHVTGIIMDGNKLYISVVRTYSQYPSPPLNNGAMFRSLDSGVTWDSIYTDISNNPITALAENNGIFYADAGLLYRSTDMEKNWKNITYDGLVPGIQFLSFSGDNVFAGLVIDTFGIGTIFWSPNDGDRWIDYTDNLKGHQIYNLFIHGNYVFAGTEHDIWRRPLSDFSKVSEKLNSSNINLSLSPNPSSGIGNISYTLAKPSQIKIEIYNTLGQSIQILNNSFESEGSHIRIFDLSAFPSGEYFFRMQTEEESQIRAIQLMK